MSQENCTASQNKAGKNPLLGLACLGDISAKQKKFYYSNMNLIDGLFAGFFATIRSTIARTFCGSA
jgi:hypothetical protein